MFLSIWLVPGLVRDSHWVYSTHNPLVDFVFFLFVVPPLCDLFLPRVVLMSFLSFCSTSMFWPSPGAYSCFLDYIMLLSISAATFHFLHRACSVLYWYVSFELMLLQLLRLTSLWKYGCLSFQIRSSILFCCSFCWYDTAGALWRSYLLLWTLPTDNVWFTLSGKKQSRCLVNLWWHLQEFNDARDADDARHYVNGKDFDGNRLIVEFARRVSRSISWRGINLSPFLAFQGAVWSHVCFSLPCELAVVSMLDWPGRWLYISMNWSLLSVVAWQWAGWCQLIIWWAFVWETNCSTVKRIQSGFSGLGLLGIVKLDWFCTGAFVLPFSCDLFLATFLSPALFLFCLSVLVGKGHYTKLLHWSLL